MQCMVWHHLGHHSNRVINKITDNGNLRAKIYRRNFGKSRIIARTGMYGTNDPKCASCVQGQAGRQLSYNATLPLPLPLTRKSIRRSLSYSTVQYYKKKSPPSFNNARSIIDHTRKIFGPNTEIQLKLIMNAQLIFCSISPPK